MFERLKRLLLVPNKPDPDEPARAARKIIESHPEVSRARQTLELFDRRMEEEGAWLAIDLLSEAGLEVEEHGVPLPDEFWQQIIASASLVNDEGEVTFARRRLKIGIAASMPPAGATSPLPKQDFGRYQSLRGDGKTASEVTVAALNDGLTPIERITMLRSVFGMSLTEAKCLADQVEADTRRDREHPHGQG